MADRELFYFDQDERAFRPATDDSSGPRFVYDNELGTYVPVEEAPAPPSSAAVGTADETAIAGAAAAAQTTESPALRFPTTDNGLASVTRVRGEGDDATTETIFGRIVVRDDGALAFEEAKPTG